MLFNEPLNSILGQLSKIKILRFLSRSQAELSGNQIAKAVGISHVKSNMALQELENHGIIIMRRIGRSNLYKLNKDHIAVKLLLKPLFEGEMNLFIELQDVILKEIAHPKPVSMILFGSIIETVARPDSDIDILIVIANNKNITQAKKELESAGEKVINIFGNQLSPIIVKINQLTNKFKKHSLYREILKNGHTLYGKKMKEILNVS